MTIQTLLFDLDGTLTDPAESITKSIQFALKKLNRPVPEKHELLWCIGPPLKQSFLTLLNTGIQEEAEEAVTLYRSSYREICTTENQLYLHITDLLVKLNTNRATLFIATSKPHFFAEKIIEHFNIKDYFQNIYGSKLNGELAEKPDLIRHILKTENIDPSTTLMVGDRRYDIEGALANQMKSVGVTWGYGSEQELKDAGADYLVHSPMEILELIN